MRRQPLRAAPRRGSGLVAQRARQRGGRSPLAGGARARRVRWPRRARTDEVVVELLRHVASRAPEARDGVEAQVDGRRLDVRERMKERQARCVRALLRRALHLAGLHEDEALLARRHVGGRLSSDALAAVHPPRVRLPVALARAPPLRERVRHVRLAPIAGRAEREHARLGERRARRDRVARFHRVALAAASAGRAHAWAGAATLPPAHRVDASLFPPPSFAPRAQPPPPRLARARLGRSARAATL